MYNFSIFIYFIFNKYIDYIKKTYYENYVFIFLVINYVLKNKIIRINLFNN